jgi:hypothetical protein
MRFTWSAKKLRIRGEAQMVLECLIIKVNIISLSAGFCVGFVISHNASRVTICNGFALGVSGNLLVGGIGGLVGWIMVKLGLESLESGGKSIKGLGIILRLSI